MWLHDALKFSKYLILYSLQVQFAVKPPEKFVVSSHSLLRAMRFLSWFKTCVKWPRGVTDTKHTFKCFVKASTQTPDTACNSQDVRCRYDMSENSRSVLFTRIHLLAVWTGGFRLWFGRTFVSFRTELTTYPIHLSCQANFRSYVTAQGDCSKKSSVAPWECAILKAALRCVSRRTGNRRRWYSGTVRLQGFQPI